mmetsp:Transcript_15578/g.39966  ORF Transcript_15578/g.39966 Transcript_15578/m.39966 type:complete len:205 (+) Transcript_15578:631-1245(+)
MLPQRLVALGHVVVGLADKALAGVGQQTAAAAHRQELLEVRPQRVSDQHARQRLHHGGHHLLLQLDAVVVHRGQVHIRLERRQQVRQLLAHERPPLRQVLPAAALHPVHQVGEASDAQLLLLRRHRRLQLGVQHGHDPLREGVHFLADLGARSRSSAATGGTAAAGLRHGTSAPPPSPAAPCRVPPRPPASRSPRRASWRAAPR